MTRATEAAATARPLNVLDAVRAEIAETEDRAGYASTGRYYVLRTILSALRAWEKDEAAKVRAQSLGGTAEGLGESALRFHLATDTSKRQIIAADRRVA